MATHSSVLAWEIPWVEEPGGLQSMGMPRVSHDCVCARACTHIHTHTHLFLGIYPFILGCPIYWHVIFHIISYDLMHFCGVNCNIFSFIYLSRFFFFLFFFLVSLAKGCLILHIFSKITALSFIDLPYCLFSLYFIYFCFDFVISFHLLTLDLLYSFTSS